MIEKEICWNITARCNQACKYCHRFLNINDLTTSEQIEILDNLKNSGITSITWTGGEALLVKDIEMLLKKSYNYGIKNKIITNGKLLTYDRIDRIHKYVDSITLSIDSVNDNINDSLGRGINHFEEVKDILDYITLKEYKLKIRINSVICKNNADSFFEMVNFLNNYQIYSWRIFKFMPLRELAIKNKDLFDVDMEKYEEIIKYVRDNSNINQIDTRVEKDMEKKYLLILANADIVMTENGKDKVVGNALNDSIKKFLEGEV